MSLPVFPAGFPVSSFRCDAADFDGANDYMRRASALTGQTNSKSGILSVWVLADALAAAGQTGAQILSGQKNTATAFEAASLFWDNSLAGVHKNRPQAVFRATSASSPFADHMLGIMPTAAWKHILWSWDASASASHVYLNDVSVPATDGDAPAFVNADVAYASIEEWTIGDYSITQGGGFRLDGGLAELYFAPGQFLDFSIAANRRKFYSPLGKPVFIGVDGSVPTGTAPLIYCHLDKGEAVANFAKNRAGKGDFTVTGALATRATSPSD